MNWIQGTTQNRVHVIGGAMLGVGAGLALVAALSAGFVGARDKHHHDPLTGEAATDYALSHLASRSHAMEAIWIAQSFEEMLPNQEFSVNGDQPAPLASAVITGTIVDIRPGAAYSIAGDAGVDGTQVAYDSPGALWRVMELTVMVENSLGDPENSGDTVRVGLAFDGGVDIASMENGLEGLDVVLPLTDAIAFPYDPTLQSIAHNGDLLGIVEDGRLSLPVMDENGADFLAGVDTVAEVEAEAEETTEPIDVVIDDAVPERTE